MPTLSVVIPVYNEEENLPELARRLEETLKRTSQSYEVIFVDDGSSDGSCEILKKLADVNPNFKIIRFSRNFGHQAAISAGINHATGEMIVMMDSDLQDPPEMIPKFIEKFKEKHDVVYAVRERRKERWWKRASYFIFYNLIRRISFDVNLPLDSGDFSLISQRVADVLKTMPERNRYVRGLRAWSGFRQVGVPFLREPRSAGVAKYGFRKLVKLAYDGIFSFSYFPITFVSILGFVFSATSFVGILGVLYIRIFKGQFMSGFVSIAIMILFVGGIQLLSVGILGEYIRRVYDESKARPHYVIEEKIGF